MKSLSNHSAFANQSSDAPPKLKQFKALTQKLSRSACQGILGLAVVAGVVGFALDAEAYMRRGAVGPAVAQVQSALGVSADGVFGRHTQSAVMAFQRRCGLAVDGVVGPETWHALFGSSVAVSSSYTPVGTTGGTSIGTPVGTPVPNNILEPGIKPPSAVLPPAVAGPYVVIVPDGDTQRLSSIQAIVPNAVLDGALQGRFINAGGYPNYSSAQEVAGRLRGYGFDARVDYFERYGGSDDAPGSYDSTSY